MQKLTLILLFIMTLQTPIIFDFNASSGISKWSVVNDVVMGGRSSGDFDINSNGHGVFKGNVSLENNGGFSSLRYRFERMNITKYTKIVLHVKGDGKEYQFRVKRRVSDYYSYIGKFKTTNEWQMIEITLKEMYPAFRGRTLAIGNYQSDSIEEIAFLIGNKKAENFMLFIDSIILK